MAEIVQPASTTPFSRLSRTGLWTPLGDFRVQLGWRLIGFAMCQVMTGDWLWPRLAGAVLMLCGPRHITLALASASGIHLVSSLLTYPLSARMSIAEEHLVFAGLPLFALLFDALGRGRATPEARAASQVLLLRWAAILLMFFVGFHKLNADFFEAAVSCNTYLGGQLDLAWAIPLADWGLLPSPVAVAGLELVASVLLLGAPRVGFLVTAGLLGPIALFGPTSLVSTVLALSSSALRPGDDLVLWRDLRRRAIGLGLLYLGVAGIVFFVYSGLMPFRIFAFLCVSVTLIGAVILSLANDVRGRPRVALLPGPGPLRALVIGFVALGLLNGMSPYLGTKFRMSFAMFSNLRADEARWNHFLVPRAFSLRDHDPFVHVERIEWVGDSRRRVRPRPGPQDDVELEPALFSPQSLRYRVEKMPARRIDAHLTLVHQGERIRFPNVAGSRTFRLWLEELPDEKLFQRKLSLVGPQGCVH